jgi:predicted nucleotidyltransferase
MIPGEAVTAFCQRWNITELALFGSVLRPDFKPGSDIDVLVSFSESARYSLFDLIHMEEELKKIFGRAVDLVDRRAIERSRNYIRRQEILSSAERVYAA